MLIRIAEEKKIPYQRQAVSRSTGTDTDSFAYSTEGIASALISLPLKYMHTTVEMVSKEDVQNVIQLMYDVLLSLKGDEDFRYIK
ncbi:putative aminopeptidase YsdC [compost metagenome]